MEAFADQHGAGPCIDRDISHFNSNLPIPRGFSGSSTTSKQSAVAVDSGLWLSITFVFKFSFIGVPYCFLHCRAALVPSCSDLFHHGDQCPPFRHSDSSGKKAVEVLGQRHKH